MYGRLRRIAEVLQGRVGQFVSVGGVPAYRGWMNPWLHEPPGCRCRSARTRRPSHEPAEDEKGYRIARTEEVVFDAPSRRRALPLPVRLRAVPARAARVVRRAPHARRPAADGRRRRRPHAPPPRLHGEPRARGAARGRSARCRRGEGLQRRRRGGALRPPGRRDRRRRARPRARARVDALRPRLPARPLLAQPLPTHRVLDLARIRGDLGYRDLVPAREALARTARWLVEHPRGAARRRRRVLTDPFDYAAEDRLMDAWLRGARGLPAVAFGRARLRPGVQRPRRPTPHRARVRTREDRRELARNALGITLPRVSPTSRQDRHDLRARLRATTRCSAPYGSTQAEYLLEER